MSEEATATPAPARRARITSVDVVRGAIMVFMALDHVRDYVSRVHFPPEDLSRGTAALFFTRWLTHFCAPGFFLLAGVGIGFMLRPPAGVIPSEARDLAPARQRKLTWFLLTRGLWLIALDLVITPIGWRFSFELLPMFALVLWALGWSMIAMAALIRLPVKAVLAISLAMIALHNAFDKVTPESLGAWAPLWHVLHVPGFVIPGVLFAAYPLIPWIGVMGAGYALSRVYTWDDARRRRALAAWGVAATLLFVVIRAQNGYGNPVPWSDQRTFALTVSSFLNVQKYPPSLDFLLMTLGPLLVALSLAERARGPVARWLEVYGRVPMFFYVVHIFVAHAVGVLIAYAQSGTWMRITATTDPAAIPAWYGLSLPGVYAAWALVVLIMYLPCRWFAHLKANRRDWWLQYL